MKKPFLITLLLTLLAACSLAACNSVFGARYGLSGNISGLTTSQVILSDGRTNPSLLTITANGSTAFSFQSGSGYLSNGEHYNVQVYQQPTGELCTVSNGSGVATANITTVAVVCTAPTLSTLVSNINYANADASASGAPNSMAVDVAGDVYSVDQSTGRLLIANGNGAISNITLTDNSGAASAYPWVQQVATDNNGNVYIAAAATESTGAVVEKVAISGLVNGQQTAVATFLAGSGSVGAADASGTAASFGSFITGLATDGAGNVFVADDGSGAANGTNRIRQVTSAGVVTTLAGTSAAGSTNGTSSAASFSLGTTTGNLLAAGSNGVLYVVEPANEDVRAIVIGSGAVTTLAGVPGRRGSTDGTSGLNNSTNVASFSSPFGIAVDSSNNVYVLDGTNNLRLITQAGAVSTLVTASNVQLLASQAGVTTTTTGIGPLTALAIDGSGNFYVSERYTTLTSVSTAETVTLILKISVH